MNRIFSGVQPTGQIHLGNYITMRNFVPIQEEADCFYCVVDMHSITVAHDPELLKKCSIELAALYVAIGIDPKKSTLFLQSHVSAHAELAWILQCHAYMGELSRMTQFKDKSKGKTNYSTGLFTYPVLMAADILLYDTAQVPVGDDQKQHIELTRDLAIRFNNKYGDTFKVPEPAIQKVGARIMSLDDPSAKMSKSNPNELSKIMVLDDHAKIKKAIMKATTDSEGIIRYDEKEKPGISNLMTIYSTMSGLSLDDITAKYDGLGYGQFKKDLVEVIYDGLAPVRDRYHEILDSGEIETILKEGAIHANEVATDVLNRVKDKIGFVRF
jgi:tryptophanyl-tRNA synthetase